MTYWMSLVLTRRYHPMFYRMSAPADAAMPRASIIRLRAQRREVLPNMAASLRSDKGLPASMLAW